MKYEEVKEMMPEIKIGSGRKIVDGKRIRMQGYSRKCAQQITETLLDKKAALISAVGDAANNQMISAMIYTQRSLAKHNKTMSVNFSSKFEDIEAHDNSEGFRMKINQIEVRLIELA